MRAILFFGDKSRFGRAHFEPFLNSGFDIQAVIIPTSERWTKFRRSLQGKDYRYRVDLSSSGLTSTVRRGLSKIKSGLKRSTVSDQWQDHNNVLFTDDVNSERFLMQIEPLDADFFFCAAYPQIFGQNLLDMPRHGCVNFHPSLLPAYRGAHPHFWTIFNGESTGGLTAHYMTREIDSGDIIAREELSIEGFTYDQYYDLIVSRIPGFSKIVQSKLLRGDFGGSPQPHYGVSLYRNDREIHRRIQWDVHSAEQIANMGRTQKCFFLLARDRVVLRAAVSSDRNRNITNDVEVGAGLIVDLGEHGPVVKAKTGYVEICEVAVERTRLSGREFAGQFRLSVGQRFF